MYLKTAWITSITYLSSTHLNVLFRWNIFLPTYAICMKLIFTFIFWNWFSLLFFQILVVIYALYKIQELTLHLISKYGCNVSACFTIKSGLILLNKYKVERQATSLWLHPFPSSWSTNRNFIIISMLNYKEGRKRQFLTSENSAVLFFLSIDTKLKMHCFSFSKISTEI